MALRSDQAVDLTEKQLMTILDQRARQHLNMSGEDFLKKLKEGSLPDSPAVTHLAMLVGESR